MRYNLLTHAECDKDILKHADYQTFSAKYRGTNFEMGNGIGPKKWQKTTLFATQKTKNDNKRKYDFSFLIIFTFVNTDFVICCTIFVMEFFRPTFLFPALFFVPQIAIINNADFMLLLSLLFISCPSHNCSNHQQSSFRVLRFIFMLMPSMSSCVAHLLLQK